MNVFERILAYFGSLFGGGQQAAQPGTVAAAVVADIYAPAATPGPLTGEAPVNFPASLTYWTWNLYGPDASATPTYPANVGATPSQGGNWRDRVRAFLDGLGTTATPPITPPVDIGFTPPTFSDGKDIETYTDPVRPWYDTTPADTYVKDVSGTYTDPVRPMITNPTSQAPLQNFIFGALPFDGNPAATQGVTAYVPPAVGQPSAPSAPSDDPNAPPATTPGNGEFTIFGAPKRKRLRDILPPDYEATDGAGRPRVVYGGSNAASGSTPAGYQPPPVVDSFPNQDP